MADEKETQAQFDLHVQINKVLQDRQGLLKAQEKALSNQVQIAVDLCKALKCEQLDDIEKRLGGVQEELKKAAEEASRMGDDLETAAERGVTGSSRLAGALKKASEHVNATTGAVAGLGVGIVNAFSGGFQTLMNFGSGIVGVLSSFGRLGKAIFALPFRLLEGLFSVAQATGGGVSPIRLELENIRKEFGSLATNEGKAGASSLAQFRAQASNLAGTGLTLRRVFGMGREGVAKAMAYNTELMKALGPAVGNFNAVIQKSAVELAMYRKGLGLTAEQQAQMMKLAQAAGKDPVDAMRDMASMAINMGEQFGINSKLISSDMAEMKQDFANFGTLSTRELAQTSVYARKLGIEVKALTGLISAFDNFEDAAQNAAKLSQSMGMNIDTMKMMNAQNPAERLSLLQKAFRETGKSVDAMNRQELKLLASQSGLSEEAAKLAFSQRGLSMSYDQVQKAGSKSEKKQLSQAEAMSKLADSIERVFGSGGGTQFKSFFDAFAEGFARGIIKSKEFMAVTRAIRRSLKEVYWGGVAIGRMFVELFPGIKEMMGGLAKLFDPARFRVLMSGLKDVFRIFFTDIQTDPKAGVKNFIKNFKSVFKDFFSSGGDGANEIGKGATSFASAIGEIFTALIPIAVDGLVKLFDKITEFLNNPPVMDKDTAAAFNKLADSAKKALSALWVKVQPALEDMFKVLWEKAGPYVEKVSRAALTYLFSRAVMQGVASAVSGAVTGFVSKQIAGIFGKTAVKTATAEVAESSITAGLRGGLTKSLARAGELSTKLGTSIASRLPAGLSRGLSGVASGISKLAGPAAIAVAIGSIGLNVSKMAEDMGPQLQEKFGKTAMQAGIGAASVIDAITLGLLPDSVTKSIAEFTAAAYDAFQKFLTDSGLKSVVEFIQTGINSMFNIFKGIGDILSGIFSGDADKVKTGFSEIFTGVISSLQNQFINMPKMMLELGLRIISGLVSVIADIVVWLATVGMKTLVEGVKSMFTGLVAGFEGLGTFIGESVYGFFDFIGKFFTDPEFKSDIENKAIKFGADLVDGIISTFSDFGQRIMNVFNDAYNRIMEYWGIASPSRVMGEIGQNLLDGIIGTFSGFADQFLDVGKRAWSFITDLFNSSTLSEFGGKIVNGIMTLITEWPTKLLSIAESAWNMFSGFFGIDKLMGLGTAIVDGVMSGLSGLKDRFLGGVSDAWTGIKEFFGWNSPATEGVGLGEGIVDGVSNGLADLMPKMLTAFESVFDLVIQNAESSIMKIVETFATGMQSIANVINSSGIITSITGMMGSIATSFVDSFTGAFRSVIQNISVGMSALQVALQASPLSATNLLSNVGSISAALDVFSIMPENITARITSARNAFSELSSLMSSAGSDPGLATVIQMSNALSGDGRVTVEHENVQINVNITVQMSAEQIARGILNINNTTDLPNKRFAVDTSRT